ncbi:hypothetical protein [Xenorhabdus bovienii]|uniref:hypothetical protein n=1 Tax=Xenorhabdus bovienii TaxID=40576 RepID=UPI0004D9531C|nr:hypothetical protein [Xenorhabdus bovienii]CDG88101.1 hypothetical protein XBFFR1_2020027 [Xenorhabdus bovienii str. feltiae France]CDG91601.1 hypothetical protein XBFFL1_1680005 [Xenorhabdus bovienii str. feltiae Florida]
MKFEELTEASQQAARNTLANALFIEMKSRRYIDDDRAKYLARNIRDSFIALESEDPKRVAGDDGAKDEEADKDVKLCGCKEGDLDFEDIIKQRNKEIIEGWFRSPNC